MDDEGYERYQAFLNGDAASFDWLVVRYRNGLTGFLQRILRDYHSAEELAEDVFVSLYFKRPVLSPGSNLRTWLYSAGKNKAINHIRWKERHKTVELSEIDASGGDEDTVLHSLYLDDPRYIKVYRSENTNYREFKATLRILCINREGLLADVTSQLSMMHISISMLMSRELKDDNAIITVTISVSSKEHLAQTTSQLSRVNGVLSIE